MMRLVLGLLAVVLAGLSWSQIQPELRAFVRDQTPGSALIVDVPRDIGVLPRSAQGQYFALNACREALASPLAVLMTYEDRADLISECEHLAQTALADAPTMAYAHLVQALASDLDRKRGQAEASYRLSEALSGDSVGLALSRTRMMIDHLERVSPETRSAFERDVARLAGSNRARRQLAQFYVRHEGAQPVLIDVITQLSPDLQRRFLRDVQRETR